jgi:hypothetical protein
MRLISGFVVDHGPTKVDQGRLLPEHREWHRLYMQPATRSLIAATAYAVATDKKVAGIYDHAADRHLRIAAECRGNRIQALDGDRRTGFGGTLPELYDEASGAFVSLEAHGAMARGYDRGSGCFYTVRVTGRQVQLYDHGEGTWFAFDVQIAEDSPAAT